MEAEGYEKMFNLEDTHWWFNGKRAFVKKFINGLPPKKGWRILDVGCGTCGMAALLRNYGVFYGIDLKENAIFRASRRGIRKLALASAFFLPFPDITFDLLTAFDLLYHKEVVDDRIALKEFYRVCKYGGYLLITDSAFNFMKSGHDMAVHARQRYSRIELAQKVNASGFRVIRISYINFFLFPFIAIKRLYEKYLHHNETARSDLMPRNPVMNRFLSNILMVEAAILKKINFPFGSSLICLAKKE